MAAQIPVTRKIFECDDFTALDQRPRATTRPATLDDMPPGAVWIRDGWIGLNHLTSGDAVLTGDALSLFPFSVGQSDYGARVEVARI